MDNDQMLRHRMKGSAEEVFDCWVTPAVVEQWWGPEGFTTRVKELDPQEGGAFAYEMTAPDGSCCLMTGVFKKIRRPATLVFELLNHCNIGLPDEVTPQLTPSLVTVNFSELQGYVEVAMTHTSLEDTYSPLAEASWGQAMIKLGNYLAQSKDKL